MPYRIRSIERIDAASLPTPLPDGVARWAALVEFWRDDAAAGPPDLVDDVVFERPLQLKNDRGRLREPAESLAEQLTALLDQIEPTYRDLIAAGKRGFRGDRNEEAHGRRLPADTTAQAEPVAALLDKTRRPQK